MTVLRPFLPVPKSKLYTSLVDFMVSDSPLVVWNQIWWGISTPLKSALKSGDSLCPLFKEMLFKYLTVDPCHASLRLNEGRDSITKNNPQFCICFPVQWLGTGSRLQCDRGCGIRCWMLQSVFSGRANCCVLSCRETSTCLKKHNKPCCVGTAGASGTSSVLMMLLT